MCLLSSNWGRLLAPGVAEYDLINQHKNEVFNGS